MLHEVEEEEELFRPGIAASQVAARQVTVSQTVGSAELELVFVHHPAAAGGSLYSLETFV